VSSFLYDTEVEDYTRNEVIPKLQDVQASTSNLMKALLGGGDVNATAPSSLEPGGGFVDGGEYLERPLVVDDYDARGTVRGRSQLKNTPNRVTNTTRQGITTLYVAVSIDRGEERAARGNALKIENLLTTKFNVAKMTMNKLIARYLHTYNAEIVAGSDWEQAYAGALGQVIGRYTGGSAYGGVDRLWQAIDSNVAGNEYWDSQSDFTPHAAADLVDSSSDSYIIKLLADRASACSIGGQTPNLHCLHKTQWNILRDVARAKQSLMTTVSAVQTAHLGYQYIEVDGVPVIWDEFQPAYTHYCLNTKSMDDGLPSLRVIGRSGGWMDKTDWIPSINQLVKVCYLTADLMLWCDNPRLQGGTLQVGV